MKAKWKVKAAIFSKRKSLYFTKLFTKLNRRSANITSNHQLEKTSAFAVDLPKSFSIKVA